MAASALAKTLRTIATPATAYTREIGFAVKVSMAANNPPRLPIIGTTYAASKLSKVRLPEFKDYICTDIQGEGDYFWVYFSKNKTTAQAWTPFKDPQRSLGNHYWPPILHDVDIKRLKLQSAVDVGSTIQRGNRYSARPIWTPSADTGTLFLLREFLSPIEFEIPQWPTPNASAVSFPVPGQGMFNFPECLHPEIIVSPMVECEDSFDPVTTGVTNRTGITTGFTIKATDPKTWVPYFLYDRQSKTATGSFHRTQMEVIPPPLPSRRIG